MSADVLDRCSSGFGAGVHKVVRPDVDGLMSVVFADDDHLYGNRGDGVQSDHPPKNRFHIPWPRKPVTDGIDRRYYSGGINGDV